MYPSAKQDSTPPLIKEQPTQATLDLWDRQKSRTVQKFVKGPIPLIWAQTAGRLPGKALQIGIALFYLTGCTKKSTVSLTRNLLEKFGVQEKAYYRALSALEKAGLVKVDREPGKRAKVTILISSHPKGQHSQG